MTVLALLTAQALTVGPQTLGPWVTPAGGGLRVKVGRAGLPAGQLMTATPWFSFDNQATWVKQFVFTLIGGDAFEKNGTPILFTSAMSPWQSTPEGALIVPTHIKLDLVVLAAFTAASVTVETL